MKLDPTIIRTKTSASLIRLLSACKKYLNIVGDAESHDILNRIEKSERTYKEEMERVGYRKYED